MEGEARALQVVTVDNGNYCLDEELLRLALLGEAADKPVALCSISGAFRGGKSFLLDYLLRYLQADDSAREGAWLGEANEPLQGFSWRGGSERDTTGLLLWSEPTIMQLPSGEEVAVLLMDTQGAFDWRSSVRDCSTVFALSALLASVQIYNVSRDIRADELQHLQLFTEYGRLAAQGEQAAFNSLQLVVRDWSCPYDHPYGSDGGSQLLQARFQDTELVALWQTIQECFQQVKSFLMPHPGLRALNKDFDGRYSELTPEFKEALLELAPTLLSPKQLTPKSVNGQVLTGRALFQYFKSYLDIFNSGQMPSPVTIFKATAQASLLVNYEEARELYRRLMEEQKEEKASVPREVLRARHESAREDSLRAFVERRTLATPDCVDEHLQKLRAEMDEQFKKYNFINENKIRKGITLAETAYKDHIENEHIAETERWLREINDANNDSAVSVAINAYIQRMTETCAPHAPALHPRELRKEDEDAQRAAESEFQKRRSRNSDHHEDTYKSRLIAQIERRQPQWTRSNEWKNKSIIETAVGVYNTSMEAYCTTSFLTPLHTMEIAVNFEENHEEFTSKACNKFYELSRGSRRLYDDDDVYLNYMLMKLLQRKNVFKRELRSHTVVAGVTTSAVAAAVTTAVGLAGTAGTFMLRFMRP